MLAVKSRESLSIKTRERSRLRGDPDKPSRCSFSPKAHPAYDRSQSISAANGNRALREDGPNERMSV